MVLFLASVLTLLSRLHAFRCYVGNLLVHMVLFPTSVLSLLSGLHSSTATLVTFWFSMFPASVLILLSNPLCNVDNLMIQQVLFLASVFNK
jgi:hypothetical protein